MNRFILLAVVLSGFAALQSCQCGAEPPEPGPDSCDGVVCTVEGALCVEGECRALCSLDVPCDEGFACVLDPLEDGAFQTAHCLPVLEERPVEAVCDDDRLCTTGACVQERCVEGCTLQISCVDAANRCVLDGPRRVCVVPTDDRAIGASCTDPQQCLSGTCVRPPHQTAAECAPACDDSEPCDDTEKCLYLEAGTRACVTTDDDGASCIDNALCTGNFCIEEDDGTRICASGCDAEKPEHGGCDDGFLCVDDERENRVCVPKLAERTAGSTCSSARECASEICGTFDDDASVRLLCAEPCGAGDTCPNGFTCWDGDQPLCGPLD